MLGGIASISRRAEGVTMNGNPSAAEGTRLTITIGSEVLHGSLADTATGRALIEQLPLTLPFSDFAGQEKLAKLPCALTSEGAPPGDDADPLTIGYYAPSQSLVLYYTHVPYYAGIIRIGTFEDSARIRDRTDDFTATIEIAE
jgi:hypothetical protein